MKYLLFVIFFTKIAFVQGQINCAENIKMNQTVDFFEILKYPMNSKTHKLNSFREVKNTTPEELLNSVISASNLEWFNYNNERKVETSTQNFEKIKNSKPDELYAIMLYKINFIANGKEYAVLKYNLHNKDETFGYAEAMVKTNNKWLISSEPEIFQLFSFIMMVDVKYIDSILKNELSDNTELNKIIILSKENNKINLNSVILKLKQELSKNKILKQILDPNRIFK